MNKKFDFQPTLFSALRNYSRDKFFADLMAGIIVGIVALPLAIAFAIASGVSPEQGIVTAIVGGFIASFLGGCSVQVSGPTGAFIVIVYGIIQKFGIEGLVVSTVMAGIILLVLGFLKMGTVIKFMPYPIIVGFTSGIALTIFSTQIKDLFGLNIVEVPSEFMHKWVTYFSSFDTINPYVLAVGIVTILIIVFTPKISRKIPGSLVAIVFVTLAVYFLKSKLGIDSIETIGDRFTINTAFPTPKWINIDLAMIKELFPSAITIALLGAIESLLSATVADGVTGEKHDSNTELVAQGAANIIVPMFGGIPVTGAIARTMTNINNGGKTAVSGIIHAVVLLLILLFLGPLTRHIPMACLAGILVIVSYNMSEWRTFRSLLKGSKSEAAVLLATFSLTVIFDLTIAIMIGLLLAMFLFMKRVADLTKVSVEVNKVGLSQDGEVEHTYEELPTEPGVEVYEIDGPFFFAVANLFDSVMSLVEDAPKVRVIRMRKVPFMDATGVHNLKSVIKSSQNDGIKIILSGVNPKVHETLSKMGFEELIGKENICSNIYDAVEKANKFAQQ